MRGEAERFITERSEVASYGGAAAKPCFICQGEAGENEARLTAHEACCGNAATYEALWGLHAEGVSTAPKHEAALRAMKRSLDRLHVFVPQWAKKMAERVGFEPTVKLPPHSISNAAPSSTRPSLRSFYTIHPHFRKCNPAKRKIRTFPAAECRLQNIAAAARLRLATRLD